MIRVVVVDDHRLFAEGLAQALNAIPDISVTEIFENGRLLVAGWSEGAADVILSDLEMVEVDGFAILGYLAQSVPIIIVSMHADDETRAEAAELGAAGFLSKSAPLTDVAAAVRAAYAGERFVLTNRQTLEQYREARLDPGAESLTRRERELLALLARGVSSTDDLAEELYISQKTVKNHLASIYEKLAVSDRAQAAVEAIRLGLTQRE